MVKYRKHSLTSENEIQQLKLKLVDQQYVILAQILKMHLLHLKMI